MITIVAIIIARNEEKIIASTINSLLAQTCSLNEIIIVNDGSMDNTRTIAKDLGCIVVDAPYHAESYIADARLTEVWNLGLAKAETFNPDYVFLSGADHVFPANYVARLLAVTHGDIVVSAGIGPTKVLRGSGRLISVDFWRKYNRLRYPNEPGWESLLLLEVKRMGFKALILSDLISKGRVVSFTKLKGWRYGRAMRMNGWLWYRAFKRSFRYFTRDPVIGLYMFIGYVSYRGPKSESAEWRNKRQRDRTMAFRRRTK